MEALFRKEFGSLRPDSEQAYKIMEKIRTGSAVLADIKDQSRRSTEQHRFWFVMANLLFESQEYFKDFETFRKCLLVKLGYFDMYEFKDGTKVPIPWSLRFGKMSQDKFTKLVDETLDFAESAGFDRAVLLAHVTEKSR